MTQEQIKIHWDKCDQIESKTVSQIDSLTARPAALSETCRQGKTLTDSVKLN